MYFTIPNLKAFKKSFYGNTGIITMPFVDNQVTDNRNFIDFENGRIISTTGSDSISWDVMPDIADVQTIENNNTKVIVVSFSDGTKEKATLSKGDTYSLEQGISICIAKKLLSDRAHGSGSSIYNKIVKRAIKVMKKNEELVEQKKKEEEMIKNKKIKAERKRARQKEKREAIDREKAIAIQTEAYLRAMSKLSDNL